MNSETGDSFSLSLPMGFAIQSIDQFVHYCKAANQKHTSQVYEEEKETRDLQS
ncbi:unnamed protein product [Prunus brigantina]